MTNPVDIWQSKLKDASPYTAKSCATPLSTLGFGGTAKGRQSSLTLGPLAIESRALTRELSRYNTSREHSAPQYKIEALQAYLWDYFSNSIKMMLQRPSSQVFHANKPRQAGQRMYKTAKMQCGDDFGIQLGEAACGD